MMKTKTKTKTRALATKMDDAIESDAGRSINPNAQQSLQTFKVLLKSSFEIIKHNNNGD
jgi:hypothetical protein